MTPPRPGVVGALAAAHDGVEAWVGAFFATFLSLALAVPAALADVEFVVRREWALVAACAAFLAGWVWLDARHLLRTWTAIRAGDRSMAPAAARRQPLPRAWARPLVAAWWLGHFVLGAGFAVVTERLSWTGAGPRPLGHLVFVTAMAVAYTWAANGYLLAGVTALTRDRRWLDRIWAARVLIDVALVGITVALPAATR